MSLISQPLTIVLLIARTPEAIVFETHRGWNAGVGELPLLGLIIGAALGALIVLLDTQYQSKQSQSGRPPRAEDRLRTALFGGPVLAIAMFWFAWSANYDSVHWVVPSLAGVFLAAAMLCIFVSFLNYLVDTYLMFAASAIAANTLARSAAGSAAPLFTRQMFSALGVGGGGSLVGGVAALLALIPFGFYKYGERIRIKSPFSPTSPQKAHDSADEAEKGKASSGGEGEATSPKDRKHDRTRSGSDEEGDTERRGDRESLDSHPFEYAVDEPLPRRHRSDSSLSSSDH